jgi:hypothetical protein
MELIRECPRCGFVHTIARPVTRPETITLLCHGCETVLYLPVPQKDFDDLAVVDAWARAEASAIAGGVGMSPREVAIDRGTLRLERDGDQVRAHLCRLDGLSITVTQPIDEPALSPIDAPARRRRQRGDRHQAD